jgi:M6 family metalloprotease-like protein
MFHQQMWRLTCAALIACCASTTWGNSASPFPVEVQQPDGTPITLFIRGTEKLHWYEYVPEAASVTRSSMEENEEDRQLARKPGFTVVRDGSGRYVFASLDNNENWAPTERVVGQDDPGTDQRRLLPPPRVRTGMAVRRLPETGLPHRAASPVGEVHNLVVLMRFADHAGRALPSKQDFEAIFNKEGGDPALAPTGSVLDFYHENSYGKMTLRSTVVDWVTLPKKEAYYADGQSGLSVKVREAMVDALNAVSHSGAVDFTKFDNENGGAGDGWIDAITFVHSGYAAEFGGVAGGADVKDRIWSHRWVINTWTDPNSGVKVRDYNVNPGLWSTSGSQPGRIGVICHELGHFFGLPDLYDYSGRGEGIGSWGLMANSWGFDGSQRHPPHMCAWSKIELGWNTAKVIDQENTFDVRAAASPQADIYRINYASGSPSEYLLVENRQPIGEFDGGIPTGTGGRGGLAIWHIDESKTENDTPGFPGSDGFPESHYMVALIPADGRYDLEKGNNRGDADDVFREEHVGKISKETEPSSNSYGGVDGPMISSISTSKEVMTFLLGEGNGGDDGETTGQAVLAGNVNLPVPASHAANFSDDRKAATLLFDRLVSVTSRSDRIDCKVATVVLPLKSSADDTKAGIDLRGFVMVDKGAAASLVVEINGNSEVVDLNAARDESPGSGKPAVAAKGSPKRARNTPEPGENSESFDWLHHLDCDAASADALTITFILITQRVLPSDANAFLAVDSVDVEMR